MKNTNTTKAENTVTKDSATIFDQIANSIKDIEAEQAKDVVVLKEVQDRINARVDLLYKFSDTLATYAKAVEVMADDYDDVIVDETEIKNYTFEQCLSIAETGDDDDDDDEGVEELDSIDELDDEDEGEDK